MKYLLTITFALLVLFSFAQEKEDVLALQKANDYVFEGNDLVKQEKYVTAEMEYRKAISEQEDNVAGAYNLGNAYYKNGNFDEALYRQLQAVKNSTDKSEKHKAYHNIGNILMQNKNCNEAVEAYKNALRNDPTDDETRYNLAIAKDCAKQQNQDNKDKEKEDDKDKKEEQDEDKKEDQGDQDKDDQGDKDKPEGEEKKDEDGKPKDNKDEQENDKGEQPKEQQQPKQQPGQLSPQQIKNILEAMTNQEQKVQEKMNAEKQKGVKIKTDKDW